MKYCNSLTKYSRFKTREVKVGNLVFGGDNPIHVQSMTTTDTMDTQKHSFGIYKNDRGGL